MKRRTMLKRVGTAGLVATGAGTASAAGDDDVTVWIDDGGQRRELTEEEVAWFDTSSCCDYEGTGCCEDKLCECECFCCCCGCT